jgi:hypothetical protein
MIHGVGRDAEYVANAVSQKLALAAPDDVP